ncbi:MAG: tRNA (adenosine(37)-N6)-dimethylallyltransferase MiaA [Planctomycetes bacterium]|jgi:tRNA dimethylallyltransferase|nr:tRNA (adenosine(37)-N6)-dimethylallyltransferase MiaA [Planctomycetota bacterium]
MSNKKGNNKIIAIIGTTASGKTRLGVGLAAKFNGEIVSADSRQVYRGMDIGTGKDLADYNFKITNHKSQISNKFKIQSRVLGTKFKITIPYHLIDIADPNDDFNLAQYQGLAYQAIDDILARGKLPILVGGTGLYAQAVVDGYILSEAKPDKGNRLVLEKLPVAELFIKLFSINPKFAVRLNNSDKNNKRRLIRYIETQINTDIGQIKTDIPSLPLPKYETLVIGLTQPLEELEKRIYKRLVERLEKEDMIGEVERLNQNGVCWRRLESFGLEYKYIAMYLQKKIDYDEMVEQLFTAIKKFSKRQMTWFRRWEKQGRKIYWINSHHETKKLIENFI